MSSSRTETEPGLFDPWHRTCDSEMGSWIGSTIGTGRGNSIGWQLGQTTLGPTLDIIGFKYVKWLAWKVLLVTR